jgi:hypothetical protein
MHVQWLLAITINITLKIVPAAVENAALESRTFQRTQTLAGPMMAKMGKITLLLMMMMIVVTPTKGVMRMMR